MWIWLCNCKLHERKMSLYNVSPLILLWLLRICQRLVGFVKGRSLLLQLLLKKSEKRLKNMSTKFTWALVSCIAFEPENKCIKFQIVGCITHCKFVTPMWHCHDDFFASYAGMRKIDLKPKSSRNWEKMEKTNPNKTDRKSKLKN